MFTFRLQSGSDPALAGYYLNSPAIPPAMIA
jgi:hypothetical protein